MTCPRCGTPPSLPAEPTNSTPLPPPVPRETRSDILVLHSVQPSSFFLFGGILGIFVGIILGAFAGVSDVVLPYLHVLPKALMSLQGKLLGALVFGFLGGVAGLLILGFIAFLKAIVLNLILSLMGGVRFRAPSAGTILPPQKKPKTRSVDRTVEED